VHHHSHDGHGHGATSATARHRTNALLFALTANLLFLVVEVVGGLAFGSLALLADAAHLVTDVVALGIALFAQIVASRPPTERHTYGFVRAEVLAAQANGVLLFAGAIAVVVEAVHRLGTTPDIQAAPVLVIGVLGLAVNAASAVVLNRQAGRDLNLRAAMLHMAFDAAGSVAVIISAIGVLLWDATWLDSVASLAIAFLVVISAWQLLRGTTRVLLEAAPAGTDVSLVRDALAREPDVDAVHHVHVWSLASETPALSAHVVLSGENWTLHDAQQRMEQLKAMLDERFGITHATLEVECHACESAEEHA
jgi:cobalt-zinc-cadmium efflux system protein